MFQDSTTRRGRLARPQFWRGLSQTADPRQGRGREGGHPPQADLPERLARQVATRTYGRH